MSGFEKFLDKARKTHSDKYDYSQVEYDGSSKKVCIICPEHGEFWQAPAEHVRGKGCPVCANERKGRKTMPTDEFVKKAVAVHGDRYAYSKTEYTGPGSKVVITCPEHGDFMQLPYSHLQGSGCPKCRGIGLSADEVIAGFRKVHGDSYDYSKVVYKSAKEKVCIVCPEHGEFWQAPQKHMIGQGCPVCGKRRGRNSH